MKITIARECGCYGDEVGQVLADRLNVPLYNKKTLTELAKKKGILEHYCLLYTSPSPRDA